MSLLEKQLNLHRAQNPLPTPLDARYDLRPFLFEEHFSFDPVHLFDSALNAIQALVNGINVKNAAVSPEDGGGGKLPEIDFAKYQDTIFSKAIGCDDKNEIHLLPRGLKTRVEEKCVELLWDLSPHLMKQEAQFVLEYLLNRFYLHVHQADALFASVVCYHESDLFLKLLKLPGLNLANSKWNFLIMNNNNNNKTISRSVIATAATRDNALLELITSAISIHDFPTNCSFLAAFGLEVIGKFRLSDEACLTILLRLINQCLRTKSSKDLKFSACILLNALVGKCPLTKQVSEAIMLVTIRRAKEFEKDAELLDELLSCCAFVYETQFTKRSNDAIPDAVYHSLVTESNLQNMVELGLFSFAKANPACAFRRAFVQRKTTANNVEGSKLNGNGAPKNDTLGELGSLHSSSFETRRKVIEKYLADLSKKKIPAGLREEILLNTFPEPVSSSIGMLLLNNEQDPVLVDGLYQIAINLKLVDAAIKNCAILRNFNESYLRFFYSHAPADFEESRENVCFLLASAVPSLAKDASLLIRNLLEKKASLTLGGEMDLLLEFYKYNPTFIFDALAKSVSFSGIHHNKSNSKAALTMNDTSKLFLFIGLQLPPASPSLGGLFEFFRWAEEIPPSRDLVYVTSAILTYANTSLYKSGEVRALLSKFLQKMDLNVLFTDLFNDAVVVFDGGNTFNFAELEVCKLVRALRIAKFAVERKGFASIRESYLQIVLVYCLSYAASKDVRVAAFELAECCAGKTGSSPFFASLVKFKRELESDFTAIQRFFASLPDLGVVESCLAACVEMFSLNKHRLVESMLRNVLGRGLSERLLLVKREDDDVGGGEKITEICFDLLGAESSAVLFQTDDFVFDCFSRNDKAKRRWLLLKFIGRVVSSSSGGGSLFANAATERVLLAFMRLYSAAAASHEEKGLQVNLQYLPFPCSAFVGAFSQFKQYNDLELEFLLDCVRCNGPRLMSKKSEDAKSLMDVILSLLHGCVKINNGPMERFALSCLEVLFANSPSYSFEYCSQIVDVLNQVSSEMSIWAALRCLKVCRPTGEMLSRLFNKYITRDWESCDVFQELLHCCDFNKLRMDEDFTRLVTTACLGLSVFNKSFFGMIVNGSECPHHVIGLCLKLDPPVKVGVLIELIAKLDARRQLQLMIHHVLSEGFSAEFVKENLKSNQFIQALVANTYEDDTLFLRFLDTLIQALVTKNETDVDYENLLQCIDTFGAILSVDLFLKVVFALLEEANDVGVTLAIRLMTHKFKDESNEWSKEEFGLVYDFVKNLSEKLNGDASSSSPIASLKSLQVSCEILGNKNPHLFTKILPLVVSLVNSKDTKTVALACRVGGVFCKVLQTRAIPYINDFIESLLVLGVNKTELLGGEEEEVEEEEDDVFSSAREALKHLLSGHLILTPTGETMIKLAKCCLVGEDLLKPFAMNIDLRQSLPILRSMRSPFPIELIDAVVAFRINFKEVKRYEEDLISICKAVVEFSDSPGMNVEKCSHLVVTISLLMNEKQLMETFRQVLKSAENESQQRMVVNILKALLSRLGELFLPVFPLDFVLKIFKNITSTSSNGAGEDNEKKSRKKVKRTVEKSDNNAGARDDLFAIDVMSCLGEYFNHATAVEDDSFELVMQGIIDQVGVCSDPSVVEALSVSFTRNVNSLEIWRIFHRKVTRLFKSSQLKTKRQAIDLLIALFSGVGKDYMALLPDTLPVMSDLLEHDDDVLKSKARKLAVILQEQGGGVDISEYL